MVARNDACVCSRSHGHPSGERRRRTTSTSSLTRPISSVVDTIGARFDLHQPLGIEQAANADQRRDRLDRPEDFAVRPTNLTPASGGGREDPGPGYAVETGTDACQSLPDHPQALAGPLGADSLAAPEPAV